MSLPIFLRKKIYPQRFERNNDFPRITRPERSCVCFITNDNPRYVAYTRLACREMRKWIRRGTPVFALTDSTDLSIPEADGTFVVSDLIDQFGMHNISNGRFPDIIFAKFLLPLVPALVEFDRIVIYDPDAIACGSEINDLLDLSFQGHDGMACSECVCFLNDIKDTLRKCGISEDNETRRFKTMYGNYEYCSGGLIIWDARRIREDEDRFTHLIHYAVQHQKECQFTLPEQHWLTACFDILPISNYYDRSDNYELEGFPVIHYAGTKKAALNERCIAAGLMPRQPVG